MEGAGAFKGLPLPGWTFIGIERPAGRSNEESGYERSTRKRHRKKSDAIIPNVRARPGARVRGDGRNGQGRGLRKGGAARSQPTHHHVDGYEYKRTSKHRRPIARHEDDNAHQGRSNDGNDADESNDDGTAVQQPNGDEVADWQSSSAEAGIPDPDVDGDIAAQSGLGCAGHRDDHQQSFDHQAFFDANENIDASQHFLGIVRNGLANSRCRRLRPFRRQGPGHAETCHIDDMACGRHVCQQELVHALSDRHQVGVNWSLGNAGAF